jgi:quinol monooxygenase YgiN
VGNQLDHGIRPHSGLTRKSLCLLTIVFMFLNKSDPFAMENRMENCCPILELRQYTLVPGQRETLVRLFEKNFIESQEECGMTVVGQFQDRNDPDRFVWIRGFANMEAREKALTQFYFKSAAWQKYRMEANATMIDVSNVLLLRPSHATSGFQLNRLKRPAFNDGGLIIATIYYFANDVDDEFISVFENDFLPVVKEAGATVLAHLVTETSKNNFPRLPVREDVRVFVWFTSFPNERAYELFGQKVATTRVLKLFKEKGVKSTEVLELLPTRRSLLRSQ